MSDEARLVDQPAAAPAQTAVPVAATTLQNRALDVATGTRRQIMRVVPQLQYQVLRLGAAGLGGIGALFAAAVVALSLWLPAQRSAAVLNSELAAPESLRDTAGSPGNAGGRVYAVLPTRLQIPAVLGLVLAQAKKSGIALDQGHYGYEPPKPGSLGRYSFEFPVKAPYPNVRDFINGTLTAIPAAGLDKLNIKRKSIGEATIDADIRFIVYVRGSSQ